MIRSEGNRWPNPLHHVASLLAIVLCCCFHTSTHAQDWPRCDIAAVLNASDPAEDDEFGHSLSADGGRIAVGVPNDDSKGSVRIFDLEDTQWIETAKIEASDGDNGDRFGTTVALDGDLLVVGVPLDVEGWGSAYIFRFDGLTWVEEQKLLPDANGSEYDAMGEAVAIVNGTVLVGVPGKVEVRTYEYDDESWVEQQTLVPNSPNDPWGFGGAIAARGDVLVIGAEYETEEPELWQGAAYVFRFDGADWLQEQRLTAAEPTMWDQFGATVAVDLDVVMIGSLWEDVLDTATGAVYVFEYDGDQWTQHALLSGSQTGGGDGFGSTIALLGDRAAVGEYVSTIPRPCYVFRRINSEWVEEQLLEPLEPMYQDDWFGSSIALTDAFALVGGDRHDSESQDESGVVHVFEVGIRTADCNENNVIDVCEIRASLTLDVGGNNVPDECEEFCELEVKLTADDAMEGDAFGGWVDVSGTTAVVTAWFNDHDDSAGAVYVFEHDGDSWVQHPKLVAGDGADGFSGHVAISDDVIMVGAESDDDGRGSAFVFRRTDDGWTEEQKLIPEDADGAFGWWVDVAGDVAVVGAPFNGAYGWHSGSAYAYRRIDGIWVEEHQFFPSDPEYWDEFGDRVAVHGDVIAVAAPLEDEVQYNGGAVYIFRYTEGQWIETQKILQPNDSYWWTGFGSAMALHGDTLLAGSECDSHVYVLNQVDGIWEHVQELTRPDFPLGGGGYSKGLAVSGETVVVGVDQAAWDKGGVAYVYQYTGGAWQPAQKIAPSDTGLTDWSGSGVGIDDDTVILGVPWHDSPAENTGAAFVFAGVTGPDCNENLSNDACDLIDGISSDENLNFVPDECEEPTCEGDVNGDGLVDPLDSGFVLARFGCEVGAGDADCDIADQNNDGLVDPLDVGFILARFGPCNY